MQSGRISLMAHAKDDIEDFVRDVKKLAEQLGYGDTAALMAV